MRRLAADFCSRPSRCNGPAHSSFAAPSTRSPRSGSDAVVAYSSGNHAQGVALAARLLGKKATIIMPADAPAIKKENTVALGAELRTYDRYREVREALGTELAEQTGATLVKPYDDPLVIAGQGTVGLEMAEQALDLGAKPEMAIVPAGGGGLTAGCATALQHRLSDISIYTAEPAGFDDHRRSLEAGRRLSNATEASSICDALLAPCPGEVTFEINRNLLRGGVAISDDAVLAAMRNAFERLKVVVEPGGATALAACLAGKINCSGKTVLVVLSGGNVDAGIFQRCFR